MENINLNWEILKMVIIQKIEKPKKNSHLEQKEIKPNQEMNI